MTTLCKAFYNINYICVNSGEIIISNKKLMTSGVKTCSVLGFSFNNKNFMTHIDEMIPNMENRLLLQLSKINISHVKTFHIWYGSLCINNCNSSKLLHKIIKKIKIPEEKIIVHGNTDYSQQITIPL